jgi:uncharacterized FAD-dependent dehydrogenase
MCPGGLVVASASEPYSIVTNGMSEFKQGKCKQRTGSFGRLC